jgi:hypothetical protein
VESGIDRRYADLKADNADKTKNHHPKGDGFYLRYL